MGQRLCSIWIRFKTHLFFGTWFSLSFIFLHVFYKLFRKIKFLKYVDQTARNLGGEVIDYEIGNKLVEIGSKHFNWTLTMSFLLIRFKLEQVVFELNGLDILLNLFLQLMNCSVDALQSAFVFLIHFVDLRFVNRCWWQATRFFRVLLKSNVIEMQSF